MITLETGVPGAGKTLYCIQKLLRPMVGAVVKHTDENGNVLDVPRRIFTNINGLLLDHVKIGPGAPWAFEGKQWKQPAGANVEGLNNWHEWAKPGDLIVYDEVQKVWPLAAAGSAVPPCIEALETHRHMGVDFIVLTQHPMLVHANLMRLVGRHLHVRRMGNMGLAIVYEWDSASKTLLYKNAMTKAPYRYDSAVFKLYKSAEMHTKQPRRVPTLLWFMLAGIAGFIAMSPNTVARMSDRFNPDSIKAAQEARKGGDGAKASPKAPAPAGAASGTVAAQAAPVQHVPPPLVLGTPAFSGCVRVAEMCRCLESRGLLVDAPREQCLSVSGFGRGAAVHLGEDTKSAAAQGISDPDTLRYMASLKGKGHR